MNYFGEPWPSGVCDEGKRVTTPVGARCHLCKEPIKRGDQGEFIVHLGRNGSGMVANHRECAFRSVVGGIGHLNGSPKCPCRGGDDPDDGHTYRASALLVWDWVKEKGLP